jgi:WD40 repeat protein
MRLFKEQGYFVAWNEETVNFYEFPNGDASSKKLCSVLMTIPCAVYEDLTTKEDFVTDVLIFNELKYICIATNFGNIKVFKWDPKKRTKKIIQTLKGHTRAITSLMYIPPRKI